MLMTPLWSPQAAKLTTTRPVNGPTHPNLLSTEARRLSVEMQAVRLCCHKAIQARRDRIVCIGGRGRFTVDSAVSPINPIR